MLAGAAGIYRLVVRGAVTIDLGIGRRVRPLGPIERSIAAPPETIFDVIAAPYLGRTPRAMHHTLRVWERSSDMALAAHLTTTGRLTTTTVETVRFERPHRITFRLLRGPVPHVTETYTLEPDRREARDSSTAASSAPTDGASGSGGETAWLRRGSKPWRSRSIRFKPRPNDAPGRAEPSVRPAEMRRGARSVRARRRRGS